ncbi:amino acid kinase family protein [Hyphomicrobium sp.]|uniref:amino acid kinase family protein n=1 Tax=Hyphomicrobium sp. TaxID=82 RepID=UPI003F6F83E6
MTPVVLKLGGSLAETGRLRTMLAIVRRARRPLVIVPGGGPFADAVRDMQRELGFSDEIAHDMALRAMHQMADAMRAIEPRLVAADTLVGMARAWRKRRVPVWLPAKLCAGDRRIPRDWTITSDGLAARLAERLGNAELIVVKSCRIRRNATAAALARQGIVDGVFPIIVDRARVAWSVLGTGDAQALEQALDAAPVPPKTSAAPSSRTRALARGRGRAGGK